MFDKDRQLNGEREAFSTSDAVSIDWVHTKDWNLDPSLTPHIKVKSMRSLRAIVIKPLQESIGASL